MREGRGWAHPEAATGPPLTPPASGRGTASPLLQMPAAEQLGDLHRVERGTFAQVVADAPDRQAVVDRRVLAHAADVSRAVARAFDGGDVSAVLALVDEHHARRLAQDVLCLGGADRSEEHTS